MSTLLSGSQPRQHLVLAIISIISTFLVSHISGLSERTQASKIMSVNESDNSDVIEEVIGGAQGTQLSSVTLTQSPFYQSDSVNIAKHHVRG